MLEAFSNLVPVDNIPPCRQVLGATVLILEVVGMLPDVIAHDGILALHQRAILVSGGSHLELAVAAQHEPGPAGAKAFRTRIIEGGLKGIKRTKGGIDSIRQLAGWGAAAIGFHNLPEHAMVGMTATIIAYRRTNVLRNFVNTTHQLINRKGCQLISLQSVIEISH